MNKKRDGITKHSKSKKRCKSKSANDKKWERPAGYYKEYETRRRGEGHVTRLRIKALTALLSEIYPSATPDKVRMIPYMVCLADREFRCHSYRQHVSCLQTHQGTPHMYGLKTIPPKSCLHHAATIIAEYKGLQKVIEKQVEQDTNENCKMIRNTGRNSVICTCRNHIIRIQSKGRDAGDKRRTLESLKRHITSAA